MIVTDDGYAIEQHLKSNQIIINYPQTYLSITNTIGTVLTRNSELTRSELTLVLQLVRLLMDKKGEDGCVKT